MYIPSLKIQPDDAIEGDIYILRFGAPVGNPETHQAEYYIGWASDGNLYQRIEQHRAGQGASITREAARRGIEIELVLTVRGTRYDERRFKNIHAQRVIARFLKGTFRHAHPATFHIAARLAV